MTACGLAAVMLFSGTLPDGEAQTVQAASEPAAQYNLAENGDMTYIAVMKNDASYDRVMEKAENMDALPEEQPQQLEQNNIAVLEMDSADADQIKQTQGVVALEEDVIFTANEEVPFNEAEVEALVDAQAELPFSQWNLDAVNLPDSLDLTGDTVRVAVLDSGVTAAEDVLVADYVDLTGSNNENPFFNDGTGHGTSIASLIGATGIGDMDGIAPGADIYEGQSLGEHIRDNDLPINVTKGKQLNNIRAAGSDDGLRIAPALKMSLEQFMEYIQGDEYIEVTPENIRLRKILLKESDRRVAAKKTGA